MFGVIIARAYQWHIIATISSWGVFLIIVPCAINIYLWNVKGYICYCCCRLLHTIPVYLCDTRPTQIVNCCRILSVHMIYIGYKQVIYSKVPPLRCAFYRQWDVVFVYAFSKKYSEAFSLIIYSRYIRTSWLSVIYIYIINMVNVYIVYLLSYSASKCRSNIIWEPTLYLNV